MLVADICHALRNGTETVNINYAVHSGEVLLHASHFKTILRCDRKQPGWSGEILRRDTWKVLIKRTNSYLATGALEFRPTIRGKVAAICPPSKADVPGRPKDHDSAAAVPSSDRTVIIIRRVGWQFLEDLNLLFTVTHKPQADNFVLHRVERRGGQGECIDVIWDCERGGWWVWGECVYGLYEAQWA